ncbi:MAG: D-alanine--D-alanine ligase [Chitinophagaceae bacterium]|nr:D-alanine--D-alanine ligase [Chitinophagaceae bacterium]
MKKNIALVTGGFSGEAVISYRTAVTIDNHLDRQLFNVYKIDITREGWFYTTPGEEKIAVDKNDFSLPLKEGKLHFDAVFIGMHGTPGEDGKLQGYFDTLGIPYTGCDATSSALTFNKRYATAVAAASGIPVANSLLLLKDYPVNPAEILSRLRFPVFVKPNNGGSSIGMSKVDQPSAEVLGAAIEKAFREDNQVLVEEMVQGREFTVGVFRSAGQLIVLPLTEVRADADKSFFDFEAKYQGKSSETTPADLEEAKADIIRDMARRVYTAFNCRGVIRIDFIFQEEEGRPYMLEVNSIPGQSEASIIPQQVRTMGWSLNEFYSKLVMECLDKK